MAYAGDLRPTEAWEMLRADPSAQLIDVRTRPEWSFVGVPSLDAVGQRPVFIAWQVYPAMHANPTFIDEVRRVAPSPARRSCSYAGQAHDRERRPKR